MLVYALLGETCIVSLLTQKPHQEQRCCAGNLYLHIELILYVCLPLYPSVPFDLTSSDRVASLFASLNLFRTALRTVLRSPISFFDTTPMGKQADFNLFRSCIIMFLGRILSRLSKDQDTLDNELSMTLFQVCTNCFVIQ